MRLTEMMGNFEWKGKYYVYLSIIFVRDICNDWLELFNHLIALFIMLWKFNINTLQGSFIKWIPRFRNYSFTLRLQRARLARCSTCRDFADLRPNSVTARCRFFEILFIFLDLLDSVIFKLFNFAYLKRKWKCWEVESNRDKIFFSDTTCKALPLLPWRQVLLYPASLHHASSRVPATTSFECLWLMRPLTARPNQMYARHASPWVAIFRK